VALIPQNPRDRNMLLIAVMGGLAVFAFMYFVWSPKQAELNTLQERVESLTERNEKIERELKHGSLAKLKAEGQRYRRDLAVLRQLVPTVNEVPALLEQVSTAARRVGLDLGDVQPEAVVSGVHFDVHRYRIGLNGDYHAIARFLTNVGSLTRIVAPINLQLTPTSKASTRVLPKETRLLQAQLEIQTYVAHAGGAAQ
jgi:type IV pilus assembly protein PilO